MLEKLSIENLNYIIGFLQTDGSHSEQTRNRWKIQIELNHKDIDILEKIFPKIDSFQKGGQINIIPGGAVQAHKHNLTDISDIYENITKKGIPVVVYEEGNNITQTAEVETSEVILYKELTDKLENLREKNNKESQLEAGKILAIELIKNTINYSKEYRDILKTKKLLFSAVAEWAWLFARSRKNWVQKKLL